MFQYEEQVREILKEFMDYPNEAPTRALIYDRLAEIIPVTEYTIICNDKNNGPDATDYDQLHVRFVPVVPSTIQVIMSKVHNCIDFYDGNN